MLFLSYKTFKNATIDRYHDINILAKTGFCKDMHTFVINISRYNCFIKAPYEMDSKEF